MPSASQIRQQFMDFFCAKHGHTFVASSPVVPLDDPTLLFANAGMNQFKPYFLGTEKPRHVRVANTQKCIRAGGKHNDLDDVGKDTYHHTFFEMLGNWSFGDYFKRDAITWAWELLTEVWQLDVERLHVTVFEGDPEAGIPRDDEAAEIWRSVGVRPEQIHLGNKKDNFWEMGETGPCGPCTEIHFDRTPDKSGGALVNGGSDQCIEIWNNVFIQFNRNPDKSLTPLPAQHVDTGMGFERICAVLNNVPSNYDTDVFTPIFTAIQTVTKARPYGGNLTDLTDTAYRVIADHIRTLTFAITDGAAPGNKGRNAVLRSILRRASRYGWQVLGLQEPFLYRLSGTVVEQLGDVFPELKRNPERVREVIYEEERSFLRTLDRGLKLFAEAAERAKSHGSSITGHDAFHLHTTYGFDKGLTQQIAGEQGLTVDMAAYDKLWDEFTEKSNAGAKNIVITAVKGTLPPTDDSPKYEPELITAKVLGWVKDNTVITSGTLQPGDTVGLLLDRTNFYAEQGGQVGDTGTIDKIDTDGVEFRVDNTLRLGETVLHMGVQLAGSIQVGEQVQLQQTTMRRIDITRNHTATHLLNLALREVLGSHVDQKGSLVDEDRTRFDFSHDKVISSEELRAIESRVNAKIVTDQPVTATVMALEEAKQLPGVRAVFGEKYPDPVRVVAIGPENVTLAKHGDSIEFCGGTHVSHTGSIGYFRIQSQEGVAKGVRRITAVTGRVATQNLSQITATIDELATKFQCRPDELGVRIVGLAEEVKTLKAELAKHLMGQLSGAVDAALAAAPTIKDHKLVVVELPTAPVEQLRTQLDRVRQMAKSALIVFVTQDEGKVPLIVALTPDLVSAGLKANEFIKPLAELIGGKGGGKPDLAQAGGKIAAAIPQLLELARSAGTTALS
ncbi:MAG: alanine--tRNA ligase [Gemmataceae bacterium]